MRNPARLLFEKIDPNLDRDITEDTDLNSLEGVRKASKLGVGFLAGSFALIGWYLVDHLGETDIDAKSTAGQIAESLGETILVLPYIAAEGVCIAGSVEMARLHRTATTRIQDLTTGS